MSGLYPMKDPFKDLLENSLDAKAKEEDDAIVYRTIRVAKKCVLGMVMTKGVYKIFDDKVKACCCGLKSTAKLPISFSEISERETKRHLADQILETIDYSKSFYSSEYIYRNRKGWKFEFPRRLRFRDDLMEQFTIDDNDPRVELRGQVGSRAKKDLKEYTILGIYRGLMLRTELIEENLLSNPYDGWSKSKEDWRTEVSKFLFSVKLKIVDPKTYKKRKFELDVSAFGYENPTSYVNDPRIYPYRNKELPQNVLDGSQLYNDPEEEDFCELVHAPNVMLICAEICGFPFPFLVTIEEVKSGQELLLHYGYDYFHKDRRH